jgi:CBS domain
MTPSFEIGACPVAEVMGTELFTLSPDTAVSSARRLVLENDIDHMLVLDNGTLAGIVCRGDLCDADRNGRVGDCMTSPVVCITPDTTLQEAIDIMGANDIDCLPVVTGTFLVGIVTWDALACADLTPRPFDAPAAASSETDGAPERDLADETAPYAEAPEPSVDRAGEIGPLEACAGCGRTGQTARIQALGGLWLCRRCRPLARSGSGGGGTRS